MNDPQGGRPLPPNLAAAQAALLGKSWEEVAKAGQRKPLDGEAEDSTAVSERETGNRARLVGSLIIGFLLIGGAALGVAAWIHHLHDVERRAAEAAAAKVEYAKTVAAGVMKSWDATDDWEEAFSSSSGRGRTPYTSEVEKALVSGKRLLIYGIIDDIKKSGNSENSIITVFTQTGAKGLDLRLSLLSPPEISNAIEARKGRAVGTYVFAVRINSVERIPAPSDRSDDDFFLAQGVLYEAEPIGLNRPPTKLSQSIP
jgi:hypothetical protein